MDIALAIEAIHQGASYFGITSGNTKEQYDSLDWHDSRTKPTWAELEAAIKTIPTEAEVQAAKANAKAALLDRLGITADEAALLLG